ncbi:MAG: hypothetical protein ACR2GH_16660, partial [Pseudonocardia sp.]
NPAYTPNLAAALNNLGALYSAVGRRADAVPPTEEAVTLRRAQAADNPAYTPNLAAALNNLERCLVEVGDLGRAEAVWQEVLGEHDPLTRSVLLFSRASAAEPGDLRAAAWLVQVCRSDDRGLLAVAHDTTRAHRAADPENWNVAWAGAGGGEPPGWVTVDPGLLAVARAWIDTPTYQDERDHLAAHSELLAPDAEAAVVDALLRVEENAADRYRQILARARAEGVDAAYQPMFLILLAEQFAGADPAEQRELLTTYRAELLDDLVRSHLDQRAEADQTGRVRQATALLRIAAHEASDPILTATFDALDEPSHFPGLLDTAARDTDRAADLLEPLATVALTAATSGPEAALAGLYLAVAAALTGDQDRAADIIGQALSWDPGSASGWVAQLARLGTTQPSVLPLIAVLAETGDDGEH